MPDTDSASPPRIESLRVRNYRALRRIDLENLTPLTVLVGPNGSGKSTVFDVFAFLSECFEHNLPHAWDRRGRGRELMSRGAEGPVEIEIKYRERPVDTGRRGNPLITYHLELIEENERPVVAKEWLRWTRGPRGRPFKFLNIARGEGEAVSGDASDDRELRVPIGLNSPDLLAVNTLGQLTAHPRIAKLRDFITSWHISYLTADAGRGHPESGPQEKLTPSGDNLANVIQYLRERHPDRLRDVVATLSRRVPLVSDATSTRMPDGRLLLQTRDAPFERPILARFVSDGTLKLLSYLVLLQGAKPYPFVGIEEPENFLHPRLLTGLAEECRAALASTQLLVTTHSPFFLDGLNANEVRVLWRAADGYTQVQQASDIAEIPNLLKEGGLLGNLWTEGWFGVGDPLNPA